MEPPARPRPRRWRPRRATWRTHRWRGAGIRRRATPGRHAVLDRRYRRAPPLPATCLRRARSGTPGPSPRR